MGVTFIYDDNSLKRFARIQRQMAKKTRVVSGQLLNSMAFSARTEALKMIPKKMIVRNRHFMTRQTRVDKARFSAQPLGQQSEYGSVPTARFSGWREQEFGGKLKERTTSLGGRVGGSKTRKMRAMSRLRAGKKFRRPSTETIANAKNDQHRASAFLSIFRRERQKIPFIMEGHKDIEPGLYVLKGGKRLTSLQQFKDRRIRRVRWMRSTNQRFMQRFRVEAEWERLWRRAMFRGRR